LTRKSLGGWIKMNEGKSCKTCKYYEPDKFIGFYCKLHKTHFYSTLACASYEEKKEEGK
jgi:hypothetical protein